MRPRQRLYFLVDISIDPATPEEVAEFIPQFTENIKQDTRDCWYPGGTSLMGYDGPKVRSVKVKRIRL